MDLIGLAIGVVFGLALWSSESSLRKRVERERDYWHKQAIDWIKEAGRLQKENRKIKDSDDLQENH